MFLSTVNDPPPDYSEKPPSSKSPEHLLRPRLSSVEEFKDEPEDHTVNHHKITTHGTDRTSTVMATTQEQPDHTSTIDNLNITVTMTTTQEQLDHTSAATQEQLDHTPATMETTEETVTNINVTSSEVMDNNTIVDQPKEASSPNNHNNNAVTIEFTPADDVTVVDHGEIAVTVNDSV